MNLGCLAVAAAAQSLILFTLAPVTGAQTAEPTPATNSSAASPAGGAPNGNQLPPVVVTGYLIPRMGQGPPAGNQL